MFAKIKSAVYSFFALIFGKWISPPWVAVLQKTKQLRPKIFWGSILSLMILISGSIYAYHWYSHLPEPNRVIANILIPKITPLDEVLTPDVLTVNFVSNKNHDQVQSVAPLNAINKPITSGITLTPSMKGEWIWASDSKLVFKPELDWPAHQQFTIKFDKNVFASNVQMQHLDYAFTTQAFKANVQSFKFYQDPVEQAVKQAVATINFNYPVNINSLAKLIILKYQDRNNKGETVPFTINYDVHKRIAYIHSENLNLPKISKYLVLTLDKNIQSSTGSAKLGKEIQNTLLIPDQANYFKITNVNASIVRNEQDRPEQILTVESTVGATEAAVNKALHVYLLPENYPATTVEKEKLNYEWLNPGEVTSSILSLSTPLHLQTIPTDKNYSTLHSYKFSAKNSRYIYVKIDKGILGFANFALNNQYATIIKVPDLPKEITFLHKGALLALGGEQKLSVLIRGLAAVKFEVSRVLPENINQLITQTQGDFNNPNFINQSFNQYNISEIFSTIQQFDASDLSKQQYTALDFAQYLSHNVNTGGSQGLFLLQAIAWDVNSNAPLDVKANRLVLVTDMAMIVKDNQDGSHDVFVQSITQGMPVANATISVLGKNGLPILTRISDDQGRVNFPTLKDFIEEREPVAYIAQLANDVSFIPFNNMNRELNFTRFDIGGIYTNKDQLGINAFVFTDRGIYRPGDTVHIATIVKQGYVQAQPAGLPIQVRIYDPRGATVLEQQMTLDTLGYLTLDFPTQNTSLTGQYSINVHIIKDNQLDSLLGSTTIRINEFQPDRMRINAKLSSINDGWISPIDLRAKVDLWNLYGAPASNRKITAKLLLSPQNIHFDKYDNYHFVDPLVDPKKTSRTFTDTLNDLITDNKGQADFDLHLERFDKATYKMIFYAEGFEAEGGRSVTTQVSALVSPLKYLIGFRADGDLHYIEQNRQRSVNFIAIDAQLKQQKLAELKILRLSLLPISTLVKKSDGTFEYQSVIQSKIMDTKPIDILEQGLDYVLPTDVIGDFSIVILDKNNNELNKLNYSVVGQSKQPLAKNAELQVKLDKEEYNAGDTISLQITAPYTGAGLITIERDKVYATRWFKTDNTSSIQTIQIPKEFQGDGYINVSFVRDWNSEDIFISPLSYSIIPFNVSHEKQAVNIDLQVPQLVKPGDELSIQYKTNVPGKIIIFAVDEGILQVTKYKTPNPLSYFFLKHALQVITQQTVDQILPKFMLEREKSSVGGDGGEEELAHHLNPFKRKTDLPVIYWSGIIDAGNTFKTVTYKVPDYFNGSLKVMAVAVAADAVGSTDKSVEVRGDFVINPNIPNFVAPGDTFEITASIANNIKDSGELPVSVKLTVTPDLATIGEATQALVISEGHEKTVRFSIRANQLSKSAKITIDAMAGDKFSVINSTLSIRPVTVYTNTISSGRSNETQKTLPIISTFYPQYRNTEATVSTSPLILLAGIQRYLDHYPYGCTEQVTSRAWPLLVMSNQSWFNQDQQDMHDKIVKTISLLSQRQMSDGGFSYWPGIADNQGNTFASVYAMHFLTEAKAHGYNISIDMTSGGINFLKNLVAENPKDPDEARIHAYAIYILTRNEIVTSNYLTNLEVYLNQDKKQAWHHDITGSYIAATYQLLHNQKEANRLIDIYKSTADTPDTTDFNNPAIADAQYLYLVAKHFPNKLSSISDSLIASLVNALNTDQINTVLSGYASLALSAYDSSATRDGTVPKMIELLTNNQSKILTNGENKFEKARLDLDASQLRFDNPTKETYFYQLTQSGFNKKSPASPIKQGLEINKEYQDAEGNLITSAKLGQEISVHIYIRTLDDSYLTNIAIVDLLPGGFEVVRDSVKTDVVDYADVREDRVVFFTSVEPSVTEISYTIKATNTGDYTIPAIVAESMYNPSVKAEGVVSKISVR